MRAKLLGNRPRNHLTVPSSVIRELATVWWGIGIKHCPPIAVAKKIVRGFVSVAVWRYRREISRVKYSNYHRILVYLC
jgi:hypothetical protein